MGGNATKEFNSCKNNSKILQIVYYVIHKCDYSIE